MNNLPTTREEGCKIFASARNCFDAAHDFRRRRARCIDYNFGRQWDDPMQIEGRVIPEKEYICEQGETPFTNNLVRRIVRNVLGVFRKRLDEELLELSSELKIHAEANRLEDLYMRTMEEFLLSGMAIHKKWIGLRNNRHGVWTEIVSPAQFFFNPDAGDVRGWDISLAGQFHNVGFEEWCGEFVRTRSEYERASILFRQGERRLRIAEVWRRERRPRLLRHPLR